MFELMGRVLGCKPTSEPTVVVVLISSNSKEDGKISEMAYTDDVDETLGSIADASFLLWKEDECLVTTPKEKGKCAKASN